MVQLELLWALQCIDRESDSIKKDASNKEAYNRLNLIKVEYNRIKEIFDKETLELNENNNAIQRLNTDLEVLDQKVKDSNRRMYDQGDSIKAIESLQKEIDEGKSRIDEIENELLAIIEMNEKLNKDIEQRKSRLKELKKEFDTLKTEYIRKNEGSKQKQEELSERRKRITEKIDQELIKQYNDIAAKRNNPVSQVIGEVCTECGVKLNAMLYDSLRKGKQLCKCDNCGRILYLE